MFRHVMSPYDRATSRPRGSGLGVLLTMPLMLACTGNQFSNRAQPQVGDAGDAILQVTSHHDHHVEVSVKPLDGSVFVLGTVRVQDRRSFRLPRTLNGRPTRVMLRCVKTGEIHETGDIAWDPRERFTLAVADLLPLSDFSARL